MIMSTAAGSYFSNFSSTVGQVCGHSNIETLWRGEELLLETPSAG